MGGGVGQSGQCPSSVGVACSLRVSRINLGFEPVPDIETSQPCPSAASEAPIKRNTRVLAMHKQSLAQGQGKPGTRVNSAGILGT